MVCLAELSPQMIMGKSQKTLSLAAGMNGKQETGLATPIKAFPLEDARGSLRGALLC